MKYLLGLCLATILFCCADDKQQQRIDDLEAEIKELKAERVEAKASKQPHNSPKLKQDKVEEMTSDSALDYSPERLRVQNEVRKITVTIDDYKSDGVGYLGEITVKLQNPTKYRFDFLAANVNYIKANGDLYKTEKVYFYNVEPFSERIEKAPESNRGVNLTVHLVDAKSDVLERDLKK
ncbi:hypothetical protein [Spirosoma aerolatum]|uniref:hypothetical protein n=1 Tax=Spirosoma aerolatum TaxID=1211326 RepID=UPI0009AEA5B3|nr:hypothetical protein [Spirosoma aerolatum]